MILGIALYREMREGRGRRLEVLREKEGAAGKGRRRSKEPPIEREKEGAAGRGRRLEEPKEGAAAADLVAMGWKQLRVDLGFWGVGYLV